MSWKITSNTSELSKHRLLITTDQPRDGQW